ncbi:MAG: hypothetical protein HY796_12260 [Elusimicrobia bacterium]|nr:hypothetical protein [Elusimicrobiota bacterium]
MKSIAPSAGAARGPRMTALRSRSPAVPPGPGAGSAAADRPTAASVLTLSG